MIIIMLIKVDDHHHDQQAGYEDGHHGHPGRQCLTLLTRLTLSFETVEGI